MIEGDYIKNELDSFIEEFANFFPKNGNLKTKKRNTKFIQMKKSISHSNNFTMIR